jgi:hypothetical protein
LDKEKKETKKLGGSMITGIDYLDLAQYIQQPGLEGGSLETKGYIPSKSSGVTIGVGVDLGQYNEYELEKMFGGGSASKGRSQYKNFIKLLKPYLGGGGKTHHKNNPLYLSKADAQFLTDKVVQYNADRIAKTYNEKAKTLGSGYTFEGLDKNIQRTIFSTLYQMGPNGADKFLTNAAKGDWNGMYNEMTRGNWGNNATWARRNREAAHLKASGGLINQAVQDTGYVERIMSGDNAIDVTDIIGTISAERKKY